MPSLADLCSNPVTFNLEESVPRSGLVEVKSLHELTDGRHPEKMSREEILSHDALGQIWMTLGSMTKACAKDGDIKPEVLEIIAYLHHKEVMPLSIYQAEPPTDRSAIHQPPLLSMLSSRILTSLSDAAWRAHEKMIVEEAKARGGDYAALRPEIPGSVYRVHVAGLRPEVWMELILWSCLHGGWIEEGAEILASLAAPSSKWEVLSWREYEDMVAANAHGTKNPWNDLEYMFKTRAATARDAPREPALEVTRTVSAEVVNAYIDALVTMVNVGVGERGIQVEYVVEQLRKLKILLHKQGKRSTLSTGSWDSLVIRIVESRGIVTEHDSGIVRALVQLSPGLGQGLESKNTRDLPDYVLDGSLAMQGLLHRALHGQIMAGSFEGALEVFNKMQTRTDVDKRKSLSSFMEGKQPLLRSLARGEMFTSNLTGIEYPAFDLQIPSTTLGSFLELATDAKAYDFGRWLLYNDDVDGPVIDESLYRDPHVQPAVIRFAAEAADNKLLSRFRDLAAIQRTSLRSMFDSQINSMRWDAATRILQYLSDSPGRTWSTQNVANVIRVMLLQVPGATEGDDKCQKSLERARTIVSDICLRRYDGSKAAHRKRLTPVQNLLAVLSALNGPWQSFCSDYRERWRHQEFMLPTKSFNTVLEGVVEAYGSAAGRRVLGIFWPYSSRRAYDAPSKLGRSRRSRMAMSKYRPTALESVKRQRIVIPVLGRDGSRRQNLVVYGACQPNTATIMLILRKALEELQSASDADVSTEHKDVAEIDRAGSRVELVDVSPRGMVKWGVQRLAELHSVEGMIVSQIDQVLSEVGMEHLRKQLPKIIEDVESEVEASQEADGPGEAYSVEDEARN